MELGLLQEPWLVRCAQAWSERPGGLVQLALPVLPLELRWLHRER